MKQGEWPDDWAERQLGVDCSMCEGRRPGHVDDLRTVFFLPSAKAWLVTNSVLPGYCVVEFDGPHISEVFEMRTEESDAYWASVRLVAKAVSEVFSPMKMNPDDPRELGATSTRMWSLGTQMTPLPVTQSATPT